MGQKENKFNESRRRFFGQASCAAVGGTTLFSTLFNLESVNAAASFNSSVGAMPGDYKALVCLLNAGGLDSFNMLVPRSASHYAQYANTRSNMALPLNTLRPINPLVSDGKQYGLHPSMVHMQSLFESNKLAFISNIGALVQPITKQQFYDGSIPIPLGLYSHSDQAMHWQTGVPHQRTAQGWGGKMADLLVSANENQTLSMNISLSGSNVFQTGNSTVEYSIHPEYGSIGIQDYNSNGWILHPLKRAAIDGMVNPVYQNVFKNTYAKTIKASIDGNEMLSGVINNAPVFNVPFSDNYLSQSFHMIAKTISGRDALQMNRQIFFIEYGGWDHHDELLNNQAAMLTQLDNALYEFNAAMEQMNTHNKVTTFSLSEFSRTLTSNGNGTDHAWGGNVFAMGGAVYGKNILGTFPSLALGSSNPLEIGGGSLIPTTSADEYFAEIALWYGVPASELVTLFPNIGYFYDTGSGSAPIGFLNLA
ncbi:MAG: DUF1501 domain-containing protein [Saprospiraceae bacterium]|nr:DUF1501 domain-containing protein [Saprospiraceae bacterium]